MVDFNLTSGVLLAATLFTAASTMQSCPNNQCGANGLLMLGSTCVLGYLTLKEMRVIG